MSGLSCVSVTAYDASLDLLERLTYTGDELGRRLTSIRINSRARAVAVLSTCQRTEVYATWSGEPDHQALLASLALDRGVPPRVLRAVARTYRGDAAARHLLRVASGLESFVLGESEIAGQVRAAAEISRSAGIDDVELERLMDAAISASRKRQRRTSILPSTRSVASVAVDAVIASSGGTLAGKRLLVVGAGQVAAVVVARAAELQATVTVCNRTRRHAGRLAAARVAIADFSDLGSCLAASDIAILATAAPSPLVDAQILTSARASDAGPLILVDLSMPRNVDPAVRALPWIRLIDLAGLRSDEMSSASDLARDLAVADVIVESELQRYRRWLAGRSAATALRRMRSGAEEIARQELARMAGDLAPEVRASVERVLQRTVHRLVHRPTVELRAAAEAHDSELMTVLAGLFDPSPSTCERSGAVADLPADEPDAAVRRVGPLLDVQGRNVRATDQAVEERSVHSAHQVTM
ncbi:MAG: glutamyl-tRNA reductase [Nocardiopsaceae bacterium]|jgi:glutamyl-tRNA reductase|nr:glutamyl-tRNA reductase [Nocardiopsaceae bacterium]